MQNRTAVQLHGRPTSISARLAARQSFSDFIHLAIAKRAICPCQNLYIRKIWSKDNEQHYKKNPLFMKLFPKILKFLYNSESEKEKLVHVKTQLIKLRIL